jgi:hypothetical protein
MLAELAAANAAFAVIKEAINNGGDLVAAGSKLGEYFGLKSQISKKAGNKGSDSEEFWAMESLRKQEEQLKQLLIYQGRAGLWDDWLKYQAKKKREREEELRQKKLRALRIKEVLYNALVGIMVALIGASGVGVLVLMAIYLLKGRM